MIEVNHYGPQTQVILWDWNNCYRRFDVVHWWFTEDYPRRVNGKWQIEYKEKTIRASLFRETWTDHDPERQNLYLHPVEFRRKL